MAQDDKKKKIVSMIATFLFVVLLTIAAFTYAFFIANTNITNELDFSVVISDEGRPVLTGYASGDLNLVVSSADMLQTEFTEPTVAATDTQKYHVSLIGGKTGSPVTCTYDLMLYENMDKYYRSPGIGSTTKEFTIKVRENGTTYVLPETNIDDINLSPGVLVSNLSIASTGTLTNNDYDVTLTFYNLNINQTRYYNLAYKFYIANIAC